MRVTIVLTALAAFAIAGCATQPANQSEGFDTTRTVSLTGRVATLLVQPDHTYVLIDVAAASGSAERWAVRGGPIAELKSTPGGLPLKPGDPVMVVAYPAKPGADLSATVPADHARLAAITKAGRLVHGIEFTLADGSTLAPGRSARTH